jgi:SAM-dependent methyltransferase
MKIPSPFSDALSFYYDEEYEKEGMRTLSDQKYLAEFKPSGATGLKILELCCGTGRLGIEIAKMGHRYTGVDISGAMLHHFRERIAEHPPVTGSIELIESDVTTLSLAEQDFDFVICCFNSLNLLGSKRLQLIALQVAHAHCKVGGKLLFDMRNPFKSYLSGLNYSSAPPLVRMTKRGTFLQRFERCSPVDDAHCQTVSGWYDETDQSGQVKRTPFSFSWCMMDKFEVKHMLKEVGFEAVVVLGSINDSQYFITAKKKEEK